MSHLIADLERALDTLRDPDFEFVYSNWSKCACGHLYNATDNEATATWYPIIQPVDKRYWNALTAVLEANDIRVAAHQSSAITLSVAIIYSIPTYEDMPADEINLQAREVAVEFVETAIRAEKAKNTAVLMDAHDQALVA